MPKPVCVFSCLTFIFLMLNLSLAQDALHLTLDQCVEMALRNDEEILKAEQTLAEAQAALKVVRSDEYLQLNFTSWYDRAKQNNESETKSYNGTIEAEQLLVRFGELPSRMDAAQEAYRLAELELQSARIDVASRARQIFYDIILIQSEIEERRIFRDELQEETQRIDQRVKEKLALEIELLDVQLGLATQELRINELERELLVKKTELLQITGADEEAELSISGELPEMQLEMEICVRTSMDKRTELKDLRGQIERQERIVQEVYWDLLPELRSSYRYKDTSIILEQEGKTWDTLLSYERPIWEKEAGRIPERNKWEFSFGLSFPLFDGFRVKGIMEQEKARLERLKIELLQREKRIRLDVRNAYQEVDNTKENMDIQATVLRLRFETLKRMEAIMETPIISQKYPHLAGISFDDVIRSREQYTEAQRAYFAQRRSYMLAQEDLRRRMGVIE